MEKLVFGTWQFTLKNCRVDQMQRVISYALEQGVEWFDTAAVYGGGDQERVLGDFPEAHVITKIPAKVKPTNSGLPLKKFYTPKYIQEMCEQSISRLNRIADILLLHNWTDEWNDYPELFYCMLELKRQGKCGGIGISLPDTYQGRVIPFPFDWIMAPLNENANWIETNYQKLLPETNICVRSLFNRGTCIPKGQSELTNCINKVDFADKVVIGMTKKDTVDKNILLFKRFI